MTEKPERGIYGPGGAWEDIGDEGIRASLEESFLTSAKLFDEHLVRAQQEVPSLSADELRGRIDALGALINTIQNASVRAEAEKQFRYKDLETELDIKKISLMLGTYATAAMTSFASAIALVQEGRVGAGFVMSAVSSASIMVGMVHFLFGRTHNTIDKEFENRITKIKFLLSAMRARLADLEGQQRRSV